MILSSIYHVNIDVLLTDAEEGFLNGSLRRCRGLQNLHCSFDIGLPHEQADAANPQVRTRASRIVRADRGFDAGRFERALAEVGLDVVQERPHGHEIVFSHRRILLRSPGHVPGSTTPLNRRQV